MVNRARRICAGSPRSITGRDVETHGLNHCSLRLPTQNPEEMEMSNTYQPLSRHCCLSRGYS